MRTSEHLNRFINHYQNKFQSELHVPYRVFIEDALEKGRYRLFRVLQRLVESRILDEYLIADSELRLIMFLLFGARNKWLKLWDLGRSTETRSRRRHRALRRALGRASRNEPSSSPEPWMEEELRRVGLKWRDFFGRPLGKADLRIPKVYTRDLHLQVSRMRRTVSVGDTYGPTNFIPGEESAVSLARVSGNVPKNPRDLGEGLPPFDTKWRTRQPADIATWTKDYVSWSVKDPDLQSEMTNIAEKERSAELHELFPWLVKGTTEPVPTLSLDDDLDPRNYQLNDRADLQVRDILNPYDLRSKVDDVKEGISLVRVLRHIVDVLSSELPNNSYRILQDLTDNDIELAGKNIGETLTPAMIKIISEYIDEMVNDINRGRHDAIVLTYLDGDDMRTFQKGTKEVMDTDCMLITPQAQARIDNADKDAIGLSEGGDAIKSRVDLAVAYMQEPSPDYTTQMYKGWAIAPVPLQLQRMKNFLSDEDVDRTMDWSRKFAEITEYVANLMEQYDGSQRWGFDLKEIIAMLRTHEIFQEYHYRAPVIDLSFLSYKHFRLEPAQRLKLPSERSAGLVLVPRDEEVIKKKLAMEPRKLTHRRVEPIYDGAYEIPSDILEKEFVIPFLKSEIEYYRKVSPGSKPDFPTWPDKIIEGIANFGFNMAETEDIAFSDCISAGPLYTSQALRTTHNFQWDAEMLSTNKHRLAAQFLYSRFRGARRAAMQFAIASIAAGAHEAQSKLMTPWRRLIIPTRREKKVVQELGVLIKPEVLEKLPEEITQPDPRPYTTWHIKMLETRRVASEITRIEVMEGMTTGKETSLPRNFMGPYLPTMLPREYENAFRLQERIAQIMESVKTSSVRASRALIYEVLQVFEDGTAGKDYDEDLIYFHPDVRGRNNVPNIYELDEFTGALPRDLEWLEFLAQSSITPDMAKPLPETVGITARTLADRLFEIWSDPVSLLVNPSLRFDPDEITQLVNMYVEAGPVKQLLFEKEMLQEDLAVLARHNRIRMYDWSSGPPDSPLDMGSVKLYWENTNIDRADFRYSWPLPTLHPEDRILWSDDIRTWIAPYRERERKSVPTSPKNVVSWGTVAEWDKTPSMATQREYTRRYMLAVAYRAGYTFRQLRNDLSNPPSDITNPTKASQREKDHYNNIWTWTHTTEQFGEEEEEGADDGDTGGDGKDDGEDDDKGKDKDDNKDKDKDVRKVVSFAKIVRKADKDRYNENWDQPPTVPTPTPAGQQPSNQSNHPDAASLVRNALVIESYRNENKLWPTPNPCDPDATPTPDPVWDWAGVEQRGRAPRFFNINRWPLELRSKKEREEQGEKVEAYDWKFPPCGALGDVALEKWIGQYDWKARFEKFLGQY